MRWAGVVASSVGADSAVVHGDYAATPGDKPGIRLPKSAPGARNQNNLTVKVDHPVMVPHRRRKAEA